MGPKFLQEHTWGTRENITETQQPNQESSELLKQEIVIFLFWFSYLGAKRGEKGATEGEITTLSRNHSFQNQHQQTAGTIIRAQTLTQRGFPWVTTLKFHSEQSGCQWEMCIKILPDQAQADWAVLQVLVTEMLFLHMASVFCSITFLLGLLNSTWHSSAEHPFLTPVALFHSYSAGMCRLSSPKSSQLPPATWQE